MKLVAALDNSQVGWITDDDDVFSFYTWLMRSHENVLSDADLAMLQAMFQRPAEVPRRAEEVGDPDFPF